MEAYLWSSTICRDGFVHRLQGLHRIAVASECHDPACVRRRQRRRPLLCSYCSTSFVSTATMLPPSLWLISRLASPSCFPTPGWPCSSAITRSPGVLPGGVRNKAREYGLETRLCTLHVWKPRHLAQGQMP
jgi:hypothetical protein